MYKRWMAVFGMLLIALVIGCGGGGAPPVEEEQELPPGQIFQDQDAPVAPNPDFKGT